MTLFKKYKIHFYLTLTIYCLFLFYVNASIAQSDEKNEILINADKLEVFNNGEKIVAKGNTTAETETFSASSNEINYEKKHDRVSANGDVVIKDELENIYFFDWFSTNKNFSEAKGLNAKIRLNDGTRIVGKSFLRSDSKINQINDAIYTPCYEKNYLLKNCPGWKLKAKKVIHDERKKNIYYEGAVLSILNIPVLYTPFFSHPDPSVNKRSGILMPNISSDSNLGTSLSIPYFYNISSNYDLTFTPTIQTKADNYYSLNYRHLTKNHMFNVDTSISDNESNTGTKNHIFINGNIKNPFGKFDYKIETSNNDTYLRKNHINEQTILTSGLNFTKEMEDSYLDFSSYVYKHLNNSSEQKWEYVYPNITFDIQNYKDPIYSLNWEINNSLLNYKTIDKNSNQQIVSEISTKKTNISKNTGLSYENTIQNRFIYFNNSAENYNQLRVFPQLASKVSYPLSKNFNETTEILEPVIMPILTPHNNYDNTQSISNGNIFSLNRETSLSQWESGPRVNYGVNWFINRNNIAINTSLGQSAKVLKDNSSEVSNYFIGNTLDFGKIGYIKTDITIDRNNVYLKESNINSSIEFNKVKFGFDYDYETLNKIKTSEQISIGAEVNIYKDTDFIISARKNLVTDKSIGNSFGLHYENDCLGINVDYFRDFTAIGDIKNSRGFSFTVTLKPFGTSKKRGKVRNFGPDL